VHALEVSVGADASDLALKNSAKRRLDDALSPLLRLARAWSGAVLELLAAGWVEVRHISEDGERVSIGYA